LQEEEEQAPSAFDIVSTPLDSVPESSLIKKLQRTSLRKSRSSVFLRVERPVDGQAWDSAFAHGVYRKREGLQGR
jgi:hypothetical protein